LPCQGAEGDPLSADFSEVFSETFAQQFEETMASLMAHNPEVMQQFENLTKAAETAGNVENGNADNSQDHEID
jgi:hypothetical protein